MRKINRFGQRIPRVPNLILANPMEVAMTNVATHTSSNQALILSLPEAAINALQFGGFNTAHWRDLCDTCNVGQVLAKPPYNLANDHVDLFLAAERVLFELNDQYTAKRTWTPRAAQLQTLKDALEIHDIQLRYVSQHELKAAADEVCRVCAEALRGNGAKNVSIVRFAA
jgi:hypothetical protein